MKHYESMLTKRPSPKAMLYRDLQTQSIGLLTQTPPPCSPEQFDSPQWDVRLLLEQASGLSRAQLLLCDRQEVPPAVSRRFNRLLKKRLKGMPIAYILGRQFFYDLELKVTPAVLIPRPDTECLVEAVLNLRGEDEPTRFLDLCTGSGCIAAAVKSQRPRWEVSACDKSRRALKVARKNFQRYRLEVNLCRGHLLKAVKGSFDVIASNPPYISQNEMKDIQKDLYEPTMALTDGKDGLSLIFEILEEAPRFLAPQGKIFIEAAPHQMKIIKEKMENLCYHHIRIIEDGGHRERVIYGELAE